MAATSQKKKTFEDYEGFVEKFKPKKTTDDCYTPPEVYDAVCGWVENEFSVSRASFVRPFFPGGDYEHYDYPDGCIVVDNPPFSIITRITDFYARHGHKFFLFAPNLTLFTCGKKCCNIITNTSIRYENGATVNTSFVTNLDAENAIRLEPGLKKIIEDAQGTERKAKMPVYVFPDNLVTAARLGKVLTATESPVKIKKSEARYCQNLDSMKANGKSIFGQGFLISDAAAERIHTNNKNSIHWCLSDREQAIVEELNDAVQPEPK